MFQTNLNADPSWVGGGDYHLQAGSAARNTGTTLGSLSVDYYGVTRPQGAASDIGAVEYVEFAAASKSKRNHMTGFMGWR